MANRRVRKETLETARGLYELGALKQLPADVVVHPKLVVTRKSGEAILKQTRTGKPTKAQRDLMRDGEVFVSKVGNKVVLSAERLSWDDFLDAKPKGAQAVLGRRNDRPPQKRKSSG